MLARSLLFAFCLVVLATPAPALDQSSPRRNGAPAPSGRLVVPPLVAKELAPLLHGQNADAAARGFRSLTEFVTVLHLAANLEIPFPTLKKRVVTERVPVDIAIRRMRPGIDVKKELARAEKAAEELVGTDN